MDETPPSFTELLIQDPTAWNDRIEVTFALNEPGTAYCRATRSDSGEVEEDMCLGVEKASNLRAVERNS